MRKEAKSLKMWDWASETIFNVDISLVNITAGEYEVEVKT